MTDEASPPAGRGSLSYGRCPACGYVMFPLLTTSPCGHDREPDLVPLDEPGVVYSWTRVWKGEDEPGDVLAMADFLGGRLRVTAPMLDVEGTTIGARVRLVTGRDTDYALVAVSDGLPST